MPPFHDPLNVGLHKATHKLNVCFKAQDILKLAVPKKAREVGVGGHSRRKKQLKPLL